MQRSIHYIEQVTDNTIRVYKRSCTSNQRELIGDLVKADKAESYFVGKLYDQYALVYIENKLLLKELIESYFMDDVVVLME